MDLSQGCRFCGTPADGLIYCSHLCANKWRATYVQPDELKAATEKRRKRDAKKKLEHERELVARFGKEAVSMIPLTVHFWRKLGAYKRMSKDEWISLTFRKTVLTLAYRADVGTEIPLQLHMFMSCRWVWCEYLRSLKRDRGRLESVKVEFRDKAINQVSPLHEAMFNELYEQQEAIVQQVKRRLSGLLKTPKAARRCKTSVANFQRVAKMLGLVPTEERTATGKLTKIWSAEQVQAVRERIVRPKSQSVRLSCDHEFSR